MASPLTNRQIPDQAILDYYNRQTYLGNSYIASSDLVTISTGAAETNLLYVSNPSTNSNAVGIPAQNVGYFQLLSRMIVPSNADGTSNFANFRFYLNPTGVSAGSSITPRSLRPGVGFSSKMTVKKSVTTATTGTFLSLSTVSIVEVNLGVMLILDPGYSMLVTVTFPSGVTNALACCELCWSEI